MANIIWIRRDRETGEESEVDAQRVKDRLRGKYISVNKAMSLATKESPATTGFADYWPKELGPDSGEG